MFSLIVICGGTKTGKTKLGKLIAFLSGAVLADEDGQDPHEVLVKHLEISSGPLVITIMEPKGLEGWHLPAIVEAAADIVIRMPHMTIIKDRYDVFR